MIGISLKKIGPKDFPHSKFFNNGKPLIADFTGVKLGLNMTDSKDIYIQYKSEGKPGEVQLRNFSSRPEPSSWQGEIKGKSAAGGKIGGGVIFEGAIDIGIQRTKLTLPKETPIDKPSDAEFKKFATMFKELSGSKEKLDVLIAQAKAGHRKDKTWWMSKYIGIVLDVNASTGSMFLDVNSCMTVGWYVLILLHPRTHQGKSCFFIVSSDR